MCYSLLINALGYTIGNYMKHLLFALLILFAPMAQANTAFDYLDEHGQIIVVEYTGCAGDTIWAMNGVAQNWASAERGTPVGHPLWVIVQNPEEVPLAIESIFLPASVVVSNVEASEAWCDTHLKQIKEDNI